MKQKSSQVKTAVSRNHTSSRDEASEPISVARLEQLRANYEAARREGRWQRPVMTDDQRQAAAQLLAELALVDEHKQSSEGAQ